MFCCRASSNFSKCINSVTIDFHYPVEDLSGPRQGEILQTISSSLNSITASDLVELKSMQRPPVVVLDVLLAIFYALGHKTREDQEQAWKQMKGGKLNLLNLIMHYDTSSLTFKK